MISGWKIENEICNEKFQEFRGECIEKGIKQNLTFWLASTRIFSRLVSFVNNAALL